MLVGAIWLLHAVAVQIFSGPILRQQKQAQCHSVFSIHTQCVTNFSWRRRQIPDAISTNYTTDFRR
jgi:hypothetical protein